MRSRSSTRRRHLRAVGPTSGRVARRTHPVDAYAAAVVRGRVPAGRYHKLSCRRHLRDRAREATADFPYRFEPELADRFVRFGSRVRHYKGEWAGRLVEFSPCQVFRLGSVFGWIRSDLDEWRRRFRTAYNEIPRKNGKSLEAAIVADYTTFFDGEPGAEGYCAATKREQAAIVFNDAKQLVKSSGLKTRIAIQARNLYQSSSLSKLEPLSAQDQSMDGLNPHVVIIDEFHAHKDRGVIDVLETAMGARRQPLMFQITTAGDNMVSPCGDQHGYACQILDGVLVDETFFAFIAHADKEDDWLEERTWRKANPHYGISVNPDDMRALATKAKGIPAAAAAFKQKRLNLWVNASSPCLSVDGWQKGQHDWEPDELAGQPCYVGIDLASSIDLCSLVAAFPPVEGVRGWRWLVSIWTPGDTLQDRARRDRAPYEVWVEQGWLVAVSGTRINHDAVIGPTLLALRDRYHIQRIGFDPWHAGTLIEDLTDPDGDYGFSEENVLAVSQTYGGMSQGCLEVQAEILGGHIDARRCPVTTWCVSNVVGQSDGKDNLMFAKGRSRGRIDPVIAGTIATALWKRFGESEDGPSVYETRGLAVVGGRAPAEAGA